MAPLARVKRLHPNAVMPHFKLDGDAGADLTCVEEYTLAPGEMKDIPVGLAVEAPVGMWYEIRPRSSTLRVRGLHVEPGTIDEGYRGPLYVFVRNENGHPVTIVPGDRLAQIVFHQRNRPVFEWAEELSASDRGEGGFGSTGLK